jgi:hypothetical protein
MINVLSKLYHYPTEDPVIIRREIYIVGLNNRKSLWTDLGQTDMAIVFKQNVGK